LNQSPENLSDHLVIFAMQTYLVAVRRLPSHMPSLGVSSLDSGLPWRHGGLLFFGRTDRAGDARSAPNPKKLIVRSGLQVAALDIGAAHKYFIAVRYDLPHMPSLGVSSLDSGPLWRHGGLLFFFARGAIGQSPEIHGYPRRREGGCAPFPAPSEIDLARGGIDLAFQLTLVRRTIR
jgi:hypothetical protein